MGSSWKRLGAVFCAAVLLFGTTASFAAPKEEFAKVKAGAISGTVADSSGKVLDGVVLKLVSDGKVVAQATTDKDGKYAFQELAAGKYDLVITGVPVIKIVASPEFENTTLKVVLPQKSGYAISKTTVTYIAIGAFATAAVVVPVAANNIGGDGGGGLVSP